MDLLSLSRTEPIDRSLVPHEVNNTLLTQTLDRLPAAKHEYHNYGQQDGSDKWQRQVIAAAYYTERGIGAVFNARA